MDDDADKKMPARNGKGAVVAAVETLTMAASRDLAGFYALAPDFEEPSLSILMNTNSHSSGDIQILLKAIGTIKQLYLKDRVFVTKLLLKVYEYHRAFLREPSTQRTILLEGFQNRAAFIRAVANYLKTANDYFQAPEEKLALLQHAFDDATNFAKIIPRVRGFEQIYGTVKRAQDTVQSLLQDTIVVFCSKNVPSAAARPPISIGATTNKRTFQQVVQVDRILAAILQRARSFNTADESNSLSFLWDEHDIRNDAMERIEKRALKCIYEEASIPRLKLYIRDKKACIRRTEESIVKENINRWKVAQDLLDSHVKKNTLEQLRLNSGILVARFAYMKPNAVLELIDLSTSQSWKNIPCDELETIVRGLNRLKFYHSKYIPGLCDATNTRIALPLRGSEQSSESYKALVQGLIVGDGALPRDIDSLGPSPQEKRRTAASEARQRDIAAAAAVRFRLSTVDLPTLYFVPYVNHIMEPCLELVKMAAMDETALDDAERDQETTHQQLVEAKNQCDKRMNDLVRKRDSEHQKVFNAETKIVIQKDSISNQWPERIEWERENLGIGKIGQGNGSMAAENERKATANDSSDMDMLKGKAVTNVAPVDLLDVQTLDRVDHIDAIIRLLGPLPPDTLDGVLGLVSDVSIQPPPHKKQRTTGSLGTTTVETAAAASHGGVGDSEKETPTKSNTTTPTSNETSSNP